MAITFQYPQNYQANIEINPLIKISFDVEIDKSSLTKSCIFLYESNTNVPIECAISWVTGTKSIHIRAYSNLKINTDYTLMIVGGRSGVYQLNPYQPFSDTPLIFTFKTGTSVNPNNPYPKKDESYINAPAFQGNAGVYKQVYDKTGEAVSHIVTTAGTIGPDNEIIPNPTAIEQYIQPSGTPVITPLSVIWVSPTLNSDDSLPASGVFTFSENIDEVIGLSITAEDILGNERINESDIDNYNFSIEDANLIISPKDNLESYPTFSPSTIYNITIASVLAGEKRLNLVTNKFQTKRTPMYTTMRKVRNGVGKIFSEISDKIINDTIYEYSMYAYENSVPKFEIDNPPSIVGDFVLCSTRLALIYNAILQSSATDLKQGLIKSKTLADFKIEYGDTIAKTITNLISELEKCIQKSGTILNIPLYKFIDGGIVSSVKSANDVRRPVTKRSWTRLKIHKPNF